jgi:hypothetical protein
MLNVRILKKYQDKNGNIVGYAIQDEQTLAVKQVYKDALKNAILSGAVKARNTTVTSDGRIISRSLKQLKEPMTDSKILKAIFTEQKHVVYGIWGNSQNPAFEQIDFEVESHVANGLYNINDLSTKTLESADVKKKSFKSVKPQHIKQLLNTYQVEIKDSAMFNVLSVDGKSKGAYNISINNGGDATVNNILFALVIDAFLAEKIKVLAINNNAVTPSIQVNTMIGKKEIIDTLKTLVKDIKEVKSPSK